MTVGNSRLRNNKTTTSTSLGYKTKIIWIIQSHNDTLDTEVVVPLKYLSNFWRYLDITLIICEGEPDLAWSGNLIISKILSNSDVCADQACNWPISHLPEGSKTDAKFEIS